MRWIVVVAIACGGAPAPTVAPVPVAAPPPPIATPAPKIEQPVRPPESQWWKGDFVQVGKTGHTEHWVESGGIRFGVHLSPDGFRVIVVDGDSLTLAFPGGHASEMTRRDDGGFTGEGASIRYAPDGDGVTAMLTRGDDSDRVSLARFDADRVPALEALDALFAADVAKRGLDGWVAAFEPGGGQLTKTGFVTGDHDIRALMADTLRRGKLAGAPTTSRSYGDWGFTVGLATYTGATTSKSTYVTIWHRQPDGHWKVALDTGAAVHDGA